MHRTKVRVVEEALDANNTIAQANRADFDRAGVRVVNFMSAPGAGKTALLERTLAMLRPTRRVAALVGDLATENDADRLRRTGAPVRQITTGTVCHLDAAMVSAALDGWRLDQLDTLFIENVGNLVCPASYDLGEHARAVLLSVTEGEDKPLKYPTIFNTADLVVVTKIDLAGAAGFDRPAFLANLQNVRPNVELLEVSARTGQGMEAWLQWVHGLATSAPAVPVRQPEIVDG